MKKMTKEEYEAHPCVGKTIDSDYEVCSIDCDGQIPKCHYAIRPRCVCDNVGPTCLEIVDEFLATKPKGYKSFTILLNLYVTCCLGREWNCFHCKYWERLDGKSAFSSTHGIEKLLSGIHSFLTYFLIRKCMSDDKDRQDAAKAMKSLILFCIKKEYCTEIRGKQVISDFWESCSNFQGEKIAKNFVDLKGRVTGTNWLKTIIMVITIKNVHSKKQDSILMMKRLMIIMMDGMMPSIANFQ